MARVCRAEGHENAKDLRKNSEKQVNAIQSPSRAEIAQALLCVAGPQQEAVLK